MTLVSKTVLGVVRRHSAHSTPSFLHTRTFCAHLLYAIQIRIEVNSDRGIVAMVSIRVLLAGGIVLAMAMTTLVVLNMP